MGKRRSGVTVSRAAALAIVALACTGGAAVAADAVERDAAGLPPLPASAAAGPLDVETVFFAGRGLAPVRLLRGRHAPPAVTATRPAPRPRPLPVAAVAVPRPAGPPISAQVVSFGNGSTQRVTVIRGAGVIPASLVRTLDPATRKHIETASLVDPGVPAVMVLRGTGARDWFSVDLFAPANAGELDRIAFAVDGVESRHGADLRMWRPQINGPQGPMQVSLAAALDVGGGNRFDLRENRLLGRAYLAQMFQRYGNWPDAVAAYNWGPGSMDQWIGGGRKADSLPFEVARYVDLVLRHALITAAGR